MFVWRGKQPQHPTGSLGGIASCRELSEALGSCAEENRSSAMSAAGRMLLIIVMIFSEPFACSVVVRWCKWVVGMCRRDLNGGMVKTQVG